MSVAKDPETRAESAGFSVSARVRAKAEFARVFEQGRRVAHPLMALHLLRDADLFAPGAHACEQHASERHAPEQHAPDQARPPAAAAGARLGLAVSRKVDPRAVGRNRIKRALREEFRHRRAQLAPGAYVVVARPPARQAPNPALRAAFVTLLQRAGALPPSGAPGTMPPPT